MTITYAVDPVALVGMVVVSFVALTRWVLRFFRWLDMFLPAKMMWLAFGVAFALCSTAQTYALSKPLLIAQLEPVLQWSAVLMYVGALLMCTFSVITTIVDGVYKYQTRTRVIILDHFNPNDWDL